MFMETKNAQLHGARPKDSNQPTENPQEGQNQGQDHGLTWRDLVTIPMQALMSKSPTRQEHLRRKYYESIGLTPEQYQYRSWLSRLLSGKPFG